MTPEGHNDLFPALEQILRDADGSDGHLCDVCYWRSRAESASVTNAPLPVTN